MSTIKSASSQDGETEVNGLPNAQRNRTVLLFFLPPLLSLQPYHTLLTSQRRKRVKQIAEESFGT